MYFTFYHFQVSRALPEKQGELEVHIKDFGQLEEELDHLLLWLSPIRNQLEIYTQASQTGPLDLKVGASSFTFYFLAEWLNGSFEFSLGTLNFICP